MQAVTLQNNGCKIDNTYINTGMARQSRFFSLFFVLIMRFYMYLCCRE